MTTQATQAGLTTACAQEVATPHVKALWQRAYDQGSSDQKAAWANGYGSLFPQSIPNVPAPDQTFPRVWCTDCQPQAWLYCTPQATSLWNDGYVSGWGESYAQFQADLARDAEIRRAMEQYWANQRAAVAPVVMSPDFRYGGTQFPDQGATEEPQTKTGMSGGTKAMIVLGVAVLVFGGGYLIYKDVGPVQT